MDASIDKSVEATIADQFRARIRRAADARFAARLGDAVDHLHALVADLELTDEELSAILMFMAEVGAVSDSNRQEWVLLSDVLGITSAIVTRQSKQLAGATSQTMRGPFYRPGAPDVRPGGTISLDGKGQKLCVSGRVQDLTGAPIAQARVETWQANADGLYENQDPDAQPDFNLRGVLDVSADGTFDYTTVCPGRVAVPQDGPVGQLLSALRIPTERPAHIHFQITAPGYETLCTHVFDARDPLLDTDVLFSVRPDLIAQFKSKNGALQVEFTFVMAPQSTRTNSKRKRQI